MSCWGRTGLGWARVTHKTGELAFVHATSTPYRDKRSHFDGQDLLEAGTGADLPRQRSGMVGMEEAEGQDTDVMPDFVAERLRGPARIAGFSLTGWDTHKGQELAILKPLDRLQRAVLWLKAVPTLLL